MHKVSFSEQFEEEVEALGHSLDDIKTALKLHLDSIGTGKMPVLYLGKTDPFNRPQSVVDADLMKIHVYDESCPTFNEPEQAAWNSARNLRQRTSDTYFVYTKDDFNEYHCHFVGVVSPAHLKCNVDKSGMKWFAPLVDAANKFNGM